MRETLITGNAFGPPILCFRASLHESRSQIPAERVFTQRRLDAKSLRISRFSLINTWILCRYSPKTSGNLALDYVILLGGAPPEPDSSHACLYDETRTAETRSASCACFPERGSDSCSYSARTGRGYHRPRPRSRRPRQRYAGLPAPRTYKPPSQSRDE